MPMPPKPEGLALNLSGHPVFKEIEDAVDEALQDFLHDEVWIVFAHWAYSRMPALADEGHGAS
jgi:hypothetical protein